MEEGLIADECQAGDFSPADDRTASDDHADCKSIRHILVVLGYTEVRLAGSPPAGSSTVGSSTEESSSTEGSSTEGLGEWKPLRLADGRFGTTDETHVILPAAGRPHVALRDAESGELVGRARRPSPEEEES